MNQDIEELLKHVGRYLLDRPDQMTITEENENGATVFRVSVHEEDRGHIIGKGGRIAESLRTLIRASGAITDDRFHLEIVD